MIFFFEEYKSLNFIIYKLKILRGFLKYYFRMNSVK